MKSTEYTEGKTIQEEWFSIPNTTIRRLNKMENQTNIRDYSEVKKSLEPAYPDSEKVDLITILNKPIVICGFKAFPSSLTEGKEFVVILATIGEKKISFNCGEIVLKQLRDIEKQLPIRTTITREKGKRYYTLK